MSNRTGDIIGHNNGQSDLLSLPGARIDNEGGSDPGTSFTHNDITALTVATSGSIKVQLSREEASANVQLLQLSKFWNFNSAIKASTQMHPRK